MENKELVIIGGGDFSKKIIRLIQNQFSLKIIGYTEIKDQGEVFGINYIGKDEVIDDLIRKNKNLSIILGIGNNPVYLEKRQTVINALAKHKNLCMNILSSNSIIDNTVKIGHGVILFSRKYY